MFELLTYTILLVGVGGILWAVFRANDTLHPLVLLLPGVLYIYVFMPLTFLDEQGTLDWFFTSEELIFVQTLNLSCILALVAGVITGCGGLQRQEHRADQYSIHNSEIWRRQAERMAFWLGGIGFLLYAYGLFNVGGFVEAYDSVKGGGHAVSGYLRDFSLLVIPAICMLMMSRQRLLTKDWLWIGLFSTPVLVHGLLSARRGPTFVAFATLAVSWYLVRNRRPRLVQVVAAGVTLAVLLLILVTFRSQIYLGSSFLSGKAPPLGEMVDQALSQEATYGNEFIYGTYSVLSARKEGYFYWGKRYLTMVFIRPIPSQIWPTKYDDMGMAGMLTNAGVLGPGGVEAHEFAPQGAAPGFVGDLYVEFAWGAVFFAFLIGWGYGFAWRRCIVMGGIWTIVYTCLLAFSLYLTMQSIEAILIRFLEVVLPTVLLWRYMSKRNNESAIAGQRIMSNVKPVGSPH